MPAFAAMRMITLPSKVRRPATRVRWTTSGGSEVRASAISCAVNTPLPHCISYASENFALSFHCGGMTYRDSIEPSHQRILPGMGLGCSDYETTALCAELMVNARSEGKLRVICSRLSIISYRERQFGTPTTRNRFGSACEVNQAPDKCSTLT